MTLAELIIKLSADTATLKTDFEKANKYASDFASNVGSLLSGALKGLSFVGLAEEMEHLAETAGKTGEEIARAMRLTGMGAEELSGLRLMAKETGSSFDQFSATLARAGKNIEGAFLNPTSQAGKLLSSLFSKAQVESLKMEPVSKRIQDVAKGILELKDPMERDYAEITIFGKGFADVSGILQAFATEGAGPAIERAREIGQLFNEEQVQKFVSFKESVNGLSAAFEGLEISIGSKLITPLSQLFGLLAGNKYMMADFKDELKLLSVGLGAQVAGLTNIGGMNNSALAGMAKIATDIATDQHANLAAFQSEMASLAKAMFPLPSFPGAPALTGGGKSGKPDTSWMREVEEGLSQLNVQDRLYNELVKELIPNQTALTRVDEQYFETLAKIGEVGDPATRAILSQLAALKSLNDIDKLFDQLPLAKNNNFAQQMQTFGPQVTQQIKLADQGTVQWGADAFKMGQQFSNAFTQMIIQGKGFTQILESMISYIGEAILKATLFETIWSALGGMGGPLGSIGEFFGGMAAGKATGGDVEPYTPYVVGEQGPELFMPSVAGSIVPNSKMMGGKGDTYIDARGADAGVEHRVRRAIAASAAAAAINGMKMAVELQKRT